MISQTSTRIVHLIERANDASVPLEWWIAELQRQRDAIPIEERATAVYVGQRGHLEYQSRMSDVEYALARARVLAVALQDAVRQNRSLSPEEAAAALDDAGLRLAFDPAGGGGGPGPVR